MRLLPNRSRATPRPRRPAGTGSRPAPADRCARSCPDRNPARRGACKKAFHCNGFGVASQSGLANTAAVDSDSGGLTTANHCLGPAGSGWQALAVPSTNALRPPTKNGTSARACGRGQRQPGPGPVQVPQLVERQQRRCRVRAAAAMPAPDGPVWRGRCRRPRPCRSRCSARAAARRHRSSPAGVDGAGGGSSWRAIDGVGAAFDVQRVVPVDEHEGRLQQVVAVGRRPVTCRKRLSLAGAGRSYRAFIMAMAAGCRGRARTVTGGGASRRATITPSPMRSRSTCQPSWRNPCVTGGCAGESGAAGPAGRRASRRARPPARPRRATRGSGVSRSG